MSIRKAYMSGYDAAVAGKSLTENPYISDSTESLWSRWNQGHFDGLSGASPAFKERRIVAAELYRDFSGA